jgi:hypothetical protein
MPNNTDQLSEIVPGFKDLPVEERLLIEAYQGKPAMDVYQATKTFQLHQKFEEQCVKCNERISSLEDSRKKFKYVFGTVAVIFGAVKGFILTKILGGW